MLSSNCGLFAGKSSEYTASRPSYPDAIIDHLIAACQLNPESRIVEIGSGTGKFAELLLRRGLPVIGCEPCGDMREKSKALLSQYGDSFTCLDASADDTTLRSQSADIVIMANALHLFDNDVALAEIKRILKPGGFIAVLYNFRNTADSELAREYESILLKYSSTYSAFAEKFHDDAYVSTFFGEKEVSILTNENPHPLTLETYLERFYSSAWLNRNQFTVHERKLFESEVATTFRRCQRHNEERTQRTSTAALDMEYQTRMYVLK